MRTATVVLKSVEEVKEFVHLANEYPEDIDLVSGRYQVNGKSIMGIFSLDLGAPLQLQVYGDKPEDFLAAAAKFMPESGKES